MKSIDGHKIVYKENQVSKHAVLLVHGITSDKDEGGFYIELAKVLNNKGNSTVRFDFRGHGKSKISSKNTTISGMISDLLEVIYYMEGNYKEFSIVAASFGASILLLLLKTKLLLVKLKSVVFLNPVTNYIKTFTPEYSDWASTFFPKNGIQGLLNHRKEIRIGNSFVLNPIMGLEFFTYNPEMVVWTEDIPLLILHGKKDTIVSIQDSVDFINKQSSEIKLIIFENASHGLDENKAEVFNKVLFFIKENFNE